MGRLRASKQAGRQVWGGRTPQGSSLTSLPRREHGQEEGSRPQSAGCGLWPPPRPPPRAAARLRACGFAAASPMLERRPSVKKVSGVVASRAVAAGDTTATPDHAAPLTTEVALARATSGTTDLRGASPEPGNALPAPLPFKPEGDQSMLEGTWRMAPGRPSETRRRCSTGASTSLFPKPTRWHQGARGQERHDPLVHIPRARPSEVTLRLRQRRRISDPSLLLGRRPTSRPPSIVGPPRRVRIESQNSRRGTRHDRPTGRAR